MPSKEELEKLIAKCQRDKGWTKAKCRKYIAGGIWGGDEIFGTPGVSDVHVPGVMKGAKIRGIPKKTGFSAVPIFKAGEWKGRRYTISDLDEIVKNTNALIHSNIHTPPLKLGHNEEQSLLKNDGLPAAGYGVNFYRIGDVIYADFSDVPEKIQELIETKRYSSISIELYEDFKHPTTNESLGKVIRAIALLGAEVPAVKGLGDIHKIFYSDKMSKYAVITFSENDLREDKMEWTKEEVKEKFPCCVDEVMKFMDANKLEKIPADKLGEIIAEKNMKKYQDDKADIKCPETFQWDEVKGECVPIGQNAGVSQKPEEERHVCPEGYKWDVDVKRCVKVMADEDSKEKKVKEKPKDEVVPDEDEEIEELLSQEIFAKKYTELKDEEKKKISGMADRIRKRERKHQPKDEKVGEEKKEEMKLAEVLIDKEPENWMPDEIESYKKGLSSAKEETLKEIDAMNVSGFPEDKRPPKGWWDRCISAVSGKTDTPERLCGWIYAHGLSPEAKARAEKTRASEDVNLKKEAEKIAEMSEIIKKYEKEKIAQLLEDLKKGNRDILLPKFDDYLKTFSEAFIEERKLIKFDDKETDLLKLFIQFLKELINEKRIIFSEVKVEKDEGIEITQEEKDSRIKEYSEAKPGYEVRNADLMLMAERISREKNIRFADALVEAEKRLNKQ